MTTFSFFRVVEAVWAYACGAKASWGPAMAMAVFGSVLNWLSPVFFLYIPQLGRVIAN
jgi:hypothetical protein